jgi:hypothetical protein
MSENFELDELATHVKCPIGNENRFSFDKEISDSQSSDLD